MKAHLLSVNNLALSAFAALFLTACVTKGTYFSSAKFSQVKIGMSTNDVAQLMPRPSQVRPAAYDSQWWIWAYEAIPDNNIAAVVIWNGEVVDIPHVTDTGYMLKFQIDTVGEPKWYQREYIAAHPALSNSEKSTILSSINGVSNFEQDRVWAAQRAAEEQRRQADALAYQKSLSDAAAAHQIMLDMTSDQLRQSWGEPESKTQSVSKDGTYEAWFYPEHSTTVSLYAGKVTHWTTSEHKPDRTGKLPRSSGSRSGNSL